MSIKRDKYDKAASDLIRALHNHTCEHCGKQGRMEAAHIFGRRHQSTRYDMDNLLCLCNGCHRNFTENPVVFTDWLYQYKGRDHVNKICKRAWTVKKWVKGEKDDLLCDMRMKLKEIENG